MKDVGHLAVDGTKGTQVAVGSNGVCLFHSLAVFLYGSRRFAHIGIAATKEVVAGRSPEVKRVVKIANFLLSELQEDAEEAEEDAKEGASEYLPKGVLTQEHTAAADETGDEDAQGEPPDRVEIEKEAVGYQGSDDAASSCRVDRNLPPHIDKQAGALNQQGADKDAAHVVGEMEAVDEMEGEGVEEKIDEVGEETMLTQTQVVEFQAIHLTPDADGEPRQQEGAEENDNQDEPLEGKGQQAEIGEQKQCNEPYQREILGTEDAG